MSMFKTSLLTAAVAMLPIAASAFPIAIAGTEGLKVIVNGTDSVIATYQGNSAAYSNDLYLGVSAAANPGDVFIFNNKETSFSVQVITRILEISARELQQFTFPIFLYYFCK